MTDRIDAHHHFWEYNSIEYGWISDSMAAIQRDFLPPDLEREIDATGVDGVVSVQARQTVVETEWLLGMAGDYPFIRGVVGWVPLVSPQVKGDLERLAADAKLKGVRHVLQDEPDENYMLRDDFNEGLALLKDFGLAYDILIFERHLPQTIEFVDRHQEQVFIVDHIAKPKISRNEVSPWRENTQELAKRQNVYCKISGLVTEANFKAWTVAQLKVYVDVVLSAFGPERTMFGSDWPVCLVACKYARWHGIVSGLIATLSPEEQQRVLGGTAIEAYKL